MTGRALTFVAITCVAIGIALYFMAAASLGDCAPDVNCVSETGRGIMFFGSPIAALVVIIFAYRQLVKGNP